MQVSQEVNDHLSGECISFKRQKDIGLIAWYCDLNGSVANTLVVTGL